MREGNRISMRMTATTIDPDSDEAVLLDVVPCASSSAPHRVTGRRR